MSREELLAARIWQLERRPEDVERPRQGFSLCLRQCPHTNLLLFLSFSRFCYTSLFTCGLETYAKHRLFPLTSLIPWFKTHVVLPHLYAFAQISATTGLAIRKNRKGVSRLWRLWRYTQMATTDSYVLSHRVRDSTQVTLRHRTQT